MNSATLYREIVPEIKDINEGRREITHLISTASVDRAGDIVDVGGWDVRNYRKNPVVLLDHDYSVANIIGRGRPFVEEKGLYSTTTFGDHELGVTAWELARTRVVRSWSVGFRGIKSHRIKDGKSVECDVCEGIKDPGWGTHFTKQELLEYSLVAIPMNQDVVMQSASSMGLDAALVQKFFAPKAAQPQSAPEGRIGPPRVLDQRTRRLQKFARQLERRAYALRIKQNAR